MSYYFASKATRDRFAGDPDRYLPQYGGFCAFGVAVGKKLDADPYFADIIDGKLFRLSSILLCADRRRLKVWVRARLLDAIDDPTALARVAVPHYPGRIERAVVIPVEAFDRNCPQHVTRRFTEAEIARQTAARPAQPDA